MDSTDKIIVDEIRGAFYMDCIISDADIFDINKDSLLFQRRKAWILFINIKKQISSHVLKFLNKRIRNDR